MWNNALSCKVPESCGSWSRLQTIVRTKLVSRTLDNFMTGNMAAGRHLGSLRVKTKITWIWALQKLGDHPPVICPCLMQFFVVVQKKQCVQKKKRTEKLLKSKLPILYPLKLDLPPSPLPGNAPFFLITCYLQFLVTQACEAIFLVS